MLSIETDDNGYLDVSQTYSYCGESSDEIYIHIWNSNGSGFTYLDNDKAKLLRDKLNEFIED